MPGGQSEPLTSVNDISLAYDPARADRVEVFHRTFWIIAIQCFQRLLERPGVGSRHSWAMASSTLNLDKLRILTGAMLLITAGTRSVVGCREVSRHGD